LTLVVCSSSGVGSGVGSSCGSSISSGSSCNSASVFSGSRNVRHTVPSLDPVRATLVTGSTDRQLMVAG
jgi:hypothetical protein